MGPALFSYNALGGRAVQTYLNLLERLHGASFVVAHNEFNDDYSVKIPGEIDVQRVRRILEELRRRLSDPQRPQIELDYIERLLKDY